MYFRFSDPPHAAIVPRTCAFLTCAPSTSTAGMKPGNPMSHPTPPGHVLTLRTVWAARSGRGPKGRPALALQQMIQVSLRPSCLTGQCSSAQVRRSIAHWGDQALKWLRTMCVAPHQRPCASVPHVPYNVPLHPLKLLTRKHDASCADHVPQSQQESLRKLHPLLRGRKVNIHRTSECTNNATIRLDILVQQKLGATPLYMKVGAIQRGPNGKSIGNHGSGHGRTT